MNHCGQSPLSSYCCAKRMRRISLTGSIMLERQQEFDRALADVARAPGAAGILFETMRRGEMDHPVMREPGEDRVDGERVRGILGALHANAASEIAPEAVGGFEHRASSTGLGVFRRQRFGLLRDRSSSRRPRTRIHSSGRSGSRHIRRCGACRRRRAVRRRRSPRRARACLSPDDRRPQDISGPRDHRDPAGK